VHDAVKSAVCRNISCLIYWPVAQTTKDEMFMFTRLLSYDQGQRHHSNWGGGHVPPILISAGDRGYKIIRWSNSSHAL